MMISILCPTYNEIEFIHELTTNLRIMEPREKEVIFIDGGSNDGTYEYLKQIESTTDNFFVLKNINRYVPYALNIGIQAAQGDIIVRIDAHCKYSSGYFINILQTFASTEADIVGGPTRIAFKCNVQEAVGFAVSSRFGIGNSKVHNIDYRGYTDSVTFGAWRKELFERIGMFDEQLWRNQDDELHYRAKSLGFKIYQEPKIELWYYPRNTIKSLFRQYFQYGLFKPLVLRKVKTEIKLRHLVPTTFIFYLILLMLGPHSILMFIPLLIYCLLLFSQIVTCNLNLKGRHYLILIYPTIHLSYGIGFLVGLFKFSFAPKSQL